MRNGATPVLVDPRGNPIRIGGRSRYEGATWSPHRSFISYPLQSARQDISRLTRRELMRKSRYLYRNSPTIRALIERIVTYVIGTGLHPTPSTSDATFNREALQAWREWAKRPDLQSRNDFSELQRITVRSALIDGDIGNLLTYGKSGRPRIQQIESHLIASADGSNSGPDGVTLDDFGRPEYYTYILDEPNGSRTVVDQIPESQMVLQYLPERAAQHRGVTILASAINSSHDIDDILALEKQAVKDASSKTDIIKTASGEIETDDVIGRSLREETDDDEEAVRFYREVFSAEAKVLKHGDEYTPYIPARPSPAWQGFMDFLTNSVCLSTGIPPSLLFGTKVGGADSRRELASAQRVIEVMQQAFAGGFQRIYEYVIGFQIDEGYLRNPPRDWWSTEWQTPARLTVDAGREAQQDREDVKAGLLTREEYFARWGLDWREQLEQCAREAAFLNELAARYGVRVPEIALRNPNELGPVNNKPQEADDA